MFWGRPMSSKLPRRVIELRTMWSGSNASNIIIIIILVSFYFNRPVKNSCRITLKLHPTENVVVEWKRKRNQEILRIGVFLKFDLQTSECPECRCRSAEDFFGPHSLLCRHGVGRLPRYVTLSKIIKRGLDAAGYPSQLESTRLDRGNGITPDSMTIFLFRSGRYSIWNATYCDTFSSGHLLCSATSPGLAARYAEKIKPLRDWSLSGRFIGRACGIGNPRASWTQDHILCSPLLG